MHVGRTYDVVHDNGDIGSSKSYQQIGDVDGYIL